MSKILKNTTATIVTITDVGQQVPASGQLTVSPSDYDKFAQSSNVITFIGNGTLLGNDGSFDLSISDATDMIKGNFPQSLIVKGQLDDTATTAVAEDAFASARVTPKRALHTNIRAQDGTELATAAAPLRIDPVGTTTQPTSDLSIALNNAAIPSSTSMIGGSDGTFVRPIAVDSLGRLITSSLTGYGADFAFGDVNTGATTRVIVRRTAYTEQTTNAQRSIASSSLLDASAGTGARTIKITYLDAAGNGPFSETLTFNGTTAVNTVATNICFIEQMEVLTGGTGGTNAGIITLYSAINKGGVTIGTIGVGESQTSWAHHYVPLGKTCNITGISCGHNGTTTGSGALFTINVKDLDLPNGIESQISDFVRLYGQTSTFSRNYSSPLKVIGPARLLVYVTPETATATTYRAAFDFFEP